MNWNRFQTVQGRLNLFGSQEMRLVNSFENGKLMQVLGKFNKGSGFIFIEYDSVVEKKYCLSSVGIKNIYTHRVENITYHRSQCDRKRRVYFYSYNNGCPYLLPVDYFEEILISIDGVLFNPEVSYYLMNDCLFYIEIYYEKAQVGFGFNIGNNSVVEKISYYVKIGMCSHSYCFDSLGESGLGSVFLRTQKFSIGGNACCLGWKGLFK